MFSVIFDMDGTLLDTQKICIPAWEYAGKLQGFDGVGESVPAVCGMNENGWTRYLEEHYKGLDTVPFKREVRSYIAKFGEVRFKDGAEELLHFLKENNIKTAIASGSSSQTVEHHLNLVGAYHLFDAIVGGGDVKNGKPAPDMFLRAARLLGADPENCFVFEDSSNGIKAGYAAGMKCIGVPDIVSFNDEIKKLMFKELESLSEAIDLFKNMCE